MADAGVVRRDGGVAASPLSIEELRELVAVLAGALADAMSEMESAGETPLPDDVYDELREREALVATFKRLPEGEVRGRLRSIFKQELEHASTERDTIAGPEFDQFTAQQALARLHAAELRDGELYAVVRRDAPSRSVW